MQFVIQSSALPDWHLEPLVRAAEYYKIPVLNVGVIPFTEEITGLDLIDPSIPTVFYGSTRLVELIAKNHKEYVPGVWWDTSLDSDICINRLQINRAGFICKLSQVLPELSKYKEYTDDFPLFIRPVSSLKPFAGFVMTIPKLRQWLIDNPHVDLDTLTRMSGYEDIWAEWRFFIIDREVITGSLYRQGTLRSAKAPEDMIMIAQAIANQGLPMDNCVMDLCLLADGSTKIVEFNAINASGIYDSDPYKIMKAIIDLVERDKC